MATTELDHDSGHRRGRRAQDPQVRYEQNGDELRVQLSGNWTVEFASAVERETDRLLQAATDSSRVLIDLSQIDKLDTLGAWVINKARHQFGGEGLAADFAGARPDHHILLNEIAYRGFQPETVKAEPSLMDLFADTGEGLVRAGKDVAHGVSFLGEIITACLRLIVRPAAFRLPALTNQLEQVAFRGVPIIVLISFLVGCIVAQQGIFQLQRFGAQTFVVNLVGILNLRELGVLLTSIMVAGRSGSAFTAEIGSMKMREEIDALRVMGLDPIAVLIVPRVLALIIGLPLLAFLAAMAAMLGSAVIAWIYGDISPTPS